MPLMCGYVCDRASFLCAQCRSAAKRAADACAPPPTAPAPQQRLQQLPGSPPQEGVRPLEQSLVMPGATGPTSSAGGSALNSEQTAATHLMLPPPKPAAQETGTAVQGQAQRKQGKQGPAPSVSLPQVVPAVLHDTAATTPFQLLRMAQRALAAVRFHHQASPADKLNGQCMKNI